MNKKIILPLLICCLAFAVSGYGDTKPNNVEAVEDVYTARAPGLIELYSLSCSADVQTIYITASTNGSEKMSEIGLKNIRIEKSEDEINWTTERTVQDMILENGCVYNLSEQEFSVEGGYYYRITLEHYAKENTRWFPQEQSVSNTSASVFIPSEDLHNKLSLTKNTLTEDVAVGDTVIPSGSAEFIVNLAENQGFSLFEFDFNIGSAYEIITDSENRPLFTKGSTMNYNSVITGSVNDNTLVFTGLSGYDCLAEEIIRFYAVENPDSGDKNFSVESKKLYSSGNWREYGSGAGYLTAGCPLICYGKEHRPVIQPDSSIYMVGDVNGDMAVNLTDAFITYYAIYTSVIPDFPTIYDVYSLFFPDIKDIRAVFIWNSSDDSDEEMIDISQNTALEILNYCADMSSGRGADTGSYITEIRHSG
ncbi:MAG: hypothetical protein NC340_05295 [Ruminococcus flavefaciens]|nr:hypothetical protein [Ruminococcus flavefaciens]MCM1231055.1 hypothetical protein [Ruminococcus flavefaciens]